MLLMFFYELSFFVTISLTKVLSAEVIDSDGDKL
jgi:hypothetical protein